jgi:alanyl-tRNA synthetase
MTVRLYQRDAFARGFSATVIGHARLGDRPSLLLDQTGFYPEAGGQLADRGVIRAGGEPLAIVDVQVDDDDRVHHVVDGPLPAVGAAIEGAIDWPRRRVHMALHTGQHLLSRALIEAAQAPTVSARLGDSACTIDVTRDAIPERELAAAEQLANDVIDDDVPVRAWFPAPDELAALPLRREPKVTREVRVVAIGDFDVSPCGGTHCARSAQIGSIRVLASERYKGMTRVTFAAGGRARALLGAHSDVATRVARELTCAPAELPASIDKLRRALADARAETAAVRARLAGALAAALAAEPGPGEVAAVVDDPELLRPLAAALAARGRDALLAARTPEGTAVLLARAAGSALDCGALLKRLAVATGGRGGGKPTHAAGRLPPSIELDAWPALLAAVRTP